MEISTVVGINTAIYFLSRVLQHLGKHRIIGAKLLEVISTNHRSTEACSYIRLSRDPGHVPVPLPVSVVVEVVLQAGHVSLLPPRADPAPALAPVPRPAAAVVVPPSPLGPLAPEEALGGYSVVS